MVILPLPYTYIIMRLLEPSVSLITWTIFFLLRYAGYFNLIVFIYADAQCISNINFFFLINILITLSFFPGNAHLETIR